MSFDLLRRRWLPVVDLAGKSDEVSLRHLLLGAQGFRRILGETPTMTAALHRLVLAVIQRAYLPLDQDAWVSLWRAKQFQPGPLEDYFSTHHDRFDLFHPAWPFFQCAAVSSNGSSSPAKLIAHRASGNNPTLFDHTTTSDRVVLEPAEAARWLVTLQAYDTGGTRTPSVKGNQKTKFSQQAPCNGFGVCLVEGRDLKETLLLNTVLYDPAGEQPTTTTRADDRPVWEDREPSNAGPPERPPRGWTDVLTWPSRRVWLGASPDGTGTVVDQVVITPGRRMDAKPHDVELMAAFHRPATSSRRSEPKPPAPVRLEGVRGVWRHSVELLLAGTDHRQRPIALDHIAEMVWTGLIPEHTVYTLRVFGQQLGDERGGSVAASLEEAVPAPVALLRASSGELSQIIGIAVKLATGAGDALGKLSRGHHLEFHRHGKLTRQQHAQLERLAADLELAYWPRLSKPFGEFLLGLGEAYRTGQPTSDAAEAWLGVVRRVARHAAERWTEAAQSRGRNLLSVGKQHAEFLRKLDELIKQFSIEVNRPIIREGAA